jgi:hypothetical protein
MRAMSVRNMAWASCVVLLLSCGGKVVLDTSSGTGAAGSIGGAGGAGGAGGQVPMTSGTFAVVGSSSGSGQVTCASSACSSDSSGDCSCQGTCTDGTAAMVSCTSGGTCSCFKGGNSVGGCALSSGGMPSCDLAQSCCAALFAQ